MHSFIKELREYIQSALPTLSGECPIYNYFSPDHANQDHYIELVPTGGFASDRDVYTGFVEEPTIEVISKDKSSREEAMNRILQIHYLFKETIGQNGIQLSSFKILAAYDQGYPQDIGGYITGNYVFKVIKLPGTFVSSVDLTDIFGDSGIIFRRDPDVYLKWSNTLNRFEFNRNLYVDGSITAKTDLVSSQYGSFLGVSGQVENHIKNITEDHTQYLLTDGSRKASIIKSLSGIYFANDGPDQDQWLNFYDGGNPEGRKFGWQNVFNRWCFETGNLYVNESITASANIMAGHGNLYTKALDLADAYLYFTSANHYLKWDSGTSRFILNEKLTINGSELLFTGSAGVRSEVGYLHLKADGGGKTMFFDCGALFTFRDADDGSAIRVTIDSSNGMISGQYQIPSYDGLPASPVRGQIALDTISGEFYGFNGIVWKQLSF